MSSDVTLFGSGLTISGIRSTRVSAAEISLKEVDAGGLTLLASAGGSQVNLEDGNASLLLSTRRGDAAISARAGRSTSFLDVVGEDHADDPNCRQGALCKGAALLYLDDGHGHTEKLSTERRETR